MWDRSNAFIAQRFTTASQTLRNYLPVERQIASDIKVMEQFAQEILEERKREKEEHPETLAEKFDLLSLFMSRKNENDNDTDFSDQYLRDMILNMILAGRDTTAQSLAWTFYLLAQNPEIRKKAMKEVDEVLGGHHPDYDSLKKLDYLHAIVTESLRLYPSVPRFAFPFNPPLSPGERC